MFQLAFRNIFRHKGRTALTLASIMVGVVALILSGGFIWDIFVQLREATIHSQLGHIQIYQAGYYSHGRRNPYGYMIQDPAQATAVVSALPQVVDVMQRIEFSGLLNNGRTDVPIIGAGMELDKEARLGSFITISAGRQLQDSDSFGILIGEGVASGLRVQPGDYVTLLLNTPDGALNSLEFEVVGVFRTLSKDYDARAVRISLGAAHDLLATQAVHSLVLALEQTEATDQAVTLLRERLGAAEYEVKAWYELADFYVKTVELYGRQFAVLQVIILIMVLLSVINSVNMAIYERTGEYGTLMALGDRGKDVFRLIVTENMLLGVVGGCGGVLLGIALAWAISTVGIPMPPPPNMNTGYVAHIQVVPSVVVTAFLVGAAATGLAALLPARRASRVPVAKALRQNI